MPETTAVEYREPEPPPEVIKRLREEKEARLKAKPIPPPVVEYPAISTEGMPVIPTEPEVVTVEGIPSVIIDGKPHPYKAIEGIPSAIISGTPIPIREIGLIDPEGEIFAGTVTTYKWEGIPGKPGQQVRKEVKIPRIELIRYSRLQGKKQFLQAIKLEFIPKDSVYVTGEKGKWQYMSAVEAAKIEARTEATEALEKYRVNGKYNLTLALSEGVSEKTILAAGFQRLQITNAEKGILALKAVTTMEEWEKDKIQLPDDKWILKSDYNNLPPYLQEIAKKQGFAGLDAYFKAYEDAVNTLQPYRAGDGYDLLKALVTRDQEIVRAAAIIYRDQPGIVAATLVYIQENYSTQWKREDWAGIPLKVSLAWRALTPWKEEEGQTFSTALEKVIRDNTQDMTAADRDEARKTFEQSLGLVYDPTAAVMAYTKNWDDAISRTAKWLDETFIPQVGEYSGDIGEKLGKVFSEGDVYITPDGIIHHEKGIGTRKATPATEVARGAQEAIVHLFSTIPATIAGVGASYITHATAGEQESAMVAPALLIAGVASWFVGRPMAFKKDPFYEIPYTMVLFRGAPATTLAKLIKKAGIRIHPRYITNTNIALEASIATAKIPKGWDAFKARELVEAVEKAWGGKAKVPVGLRRLKPKEQAIVTSAVKGDVIFQDAQGKITGRVTSFQMTTPMTGFHATSNVATLLRQMKEKGYIEVLPIGDYGGFWMSQQFAQTFMNRGKIVEPGGVMIRFNWTDLRDLPPSVLRQPTFEKMKVEMERLARAGKLPQGIYPVYKAWGTPPRFELEMFVSPGTRLYGVKGKWYAPDSRGTAEMRTTSMISVRNPTTAKTNISSLERSIQQLKREKPETVGKQGEIIYQRQPIPHPTKAGEMHSRITGIIRNPKTGEILLVMDRAEAAYGLVGGGVDLSWIHERPPQGHTWESALSNQCASEVNFGTTGAQYLGLYLGKVNEYALSGSRVYIAAGKGIRIDPIGANNRLIKEGYYAKGKTPEIQKAFWWNGKTPITVYPAVFDILQAVAKRFNLDMTKVSIYKESPPVLFQTRDTNFASRVLSGKLINPLNIRAMNRTSILNLERTLATLRKQAVQRVGEITPGQSIPMLVTATKEAGVAKMGVPTLGQLYKAEILNPWIGAKKWLPWRIRTREVLAGETSAPTAGSPWRSTYTGIQLTPTIAARMKTQWSRLIANTTLLAMRQKGSPLYNYWISLTRRVLRKTRVTHKDVSKVMEEVLLERIFEDFIKKEQKNVEARAEARALKGEDYHTAFLEEQTKAADAYLRQLSKEFPEMAKQQKLMAELQGTMELEYGQLAYRRIGRTRDRLSLAIKPTEREVAIGRVRYREIAVPSSFEYAVLYPDMFFRTYPKPRIPTKRELEEPIRPEPRKAFEPEPTDDYKPEPEPTPKPYEPEELRIVEPREPTPYEPPERPPEELPEREPIKPPDKLPKEPAITEAEKEEEEKRTKLKLYPITWRQGFVWWVIYPPYKKKSDVKCLRKPPVGAKVVKGIDSAYKTIQALGGDVNIVLDIDMGIMDIAVRGRGRQVSIKYKRDIKQKTRREVSLAGVKA